MLITVSHRSWNSNPRPTSNFELLTGFTDLGSMDGKKTLLGVILNTTMSDTQLTIPPPIYSFTIEYRISPDNPFMHLGNFTMSYDENYDPSGYREIKIDFTSPISNIHNLQLRVKGFTRGDFGINDLGLIYRTHRDTSEVSLDD